MDWIGHFQLFLFDFDGLLVNTEHLHYQAYLRMLTQRGYLVDWTFSRFCELAHSSAEGLRNQIYAEFPGIEPDWTLLYEEKKRFYLELLHAGKVELMPGVENLLICLEKENIRRCVVTNSLLEQVKLLASQIPLLQTIPYWVTRECYGKPKPDPECYLKAIELYGKKGDRIIGFEDSARGIQSLRQTPALPVLVCPPHPLLGIALEGGGLYFESFEKISMTGLL